MIVIYHNPRCSKSRAALQLLQARGITPRVVEYLKTPPARSELEHLLKLLGLTAGQLVRRKEPEFAHAKLDGADDEKILDAMTRHPVLIERPIVIAGDKAAIGRPAENILTIL